MAIHSSGNPTWVDWPDASTLVTALSLEQIEAMIDLLIGGAHARYECTVAGGQNITQNGTPQTIPYNNPVHTHADVAHPNNQQFVLNRAGVWRLSAGLRLQTTVAGYHQFMIYDGTSANRYAEVAYPSNTVTSFNVSTERRFAAGASVYAGLAIGGSGGSDKVATDVPGSSFFAATWIRP